MIKLYIDWISQPSRAVKAVLDILKVPHEVKALKIQFDEHKSPEFTAIHPLQQLPVLQDGDFIVAESHNIMRYIIKQRNISTNLQVSKKQQDTLLQTSDNKLEQINIQTIIIQIQEDVYICIVKESNRNRIIRNYIKIKQQLLLTIPFSAYTERLQYLLEISQYLILLYQQNQKTISIGVITVSPIKGEKVIPEVLEKEKQDVAKVFSYFENNWLKGRNYICGDQVTLADRTDATQFLTYFINLSKRQLILEYK